MGSELTCEDRSPSHSIPTSGKQRSQTRLMNILAANYQSLLSSFISVSSVVHALRPADIKVVAAMGDSLTVINIPVLMY